MLIQIKEINKRSFVFFLFECRAIYLQDGNRLQINIILFSSSHVSAYEKKKTNLHIFIDIFMNFVFAVSEQLNECFELVPYDRIESLFGEILWRPFLMETL